MGRDARRRRSIFALAACWMGLACLAGASYRTPNFVVKAPDESSAKQIGDAAEQFRRELAKEWLGKTLPNWAQPCPITVQIGEHLGAGGATSFVFDRGQVFGWQMTIQGSLERVLDSVLPHEVTHTIFASHFRQPLPRWADEGACTTVEHTSERAKQDRMLIQFLKTQRGIPFNHMFAMTEYPRDILPLYAQGYSLASFLIDQGGKPKFLEYVGDGLDGNDWTAATERHYGYRNLAELQTQWLEWVRLGSPPLESSPTTLLASRDTRPKVERTAAPPAATNDVVADSSPQSRGVSQFPLAGPLVPLRPGPANRDFAMSDRTSSAARPANAPGSDGWHAARTQSVASNNARTASNVAQRDVAPIPVHWDQVVAGNAAALGRLAAAASNATAHFDSVARPPDIETPRQTILEWSHEPAGTGNGVPVANPAGYAPGQRSIYEAQVDAPATLRR